jgi:ABC-type oligopeptide transport system ATPase subunit
MRVQHLVMEPLNHFSIGSTSERIEKVRYFLHKVGLQPEHLARYPGELSRGQCQRVNIARSLVLEPKIIICDEIITALDVAVGTQILQLLSDLQRENNYGYLFISHDLARVAQISHRVAVMHKGSIVEIADGRDFHLRAQHPYSRALIEAVPRMTCFLPDHNSIHASP